jgi:hypothetical protein
MLDKSTDIATKKKSFEVLCGQEELTRFSGINKVMSMLDEWEIKGVKRDLCNICDIMVKRYLIRFIILFDK